MKKNLVLLLMGMWIVSCSSNDDNASSDSDISTGDYLPLTNGNYWVYDVQGDLPTGSDSIYVSGDVNIGGTTFKKFSMDEAPFGFFSTSLNNNGVRKEGDRILISGTAMISFIQDLPLTINLNNFTMLDESAGNGTVVGTVSGSTPYQYEGYTFNFNYTLSSVAMSTLATYTAPNGEVYTDVKPVAIRLNVSVGTSVGNGEFNFPVIIMPAQDVVVSTRYFAKNVGVVHSSTDVHYELTDFSSVGVQLPLPQTFDAQQDEVLIEYQAE